MKIVNIIGWVLLVGSTFFGMWAFGGSDAKNSKRASVAWIFANILLLISEPMPD